MSRPGFDVICTLIWSDSTRVPPVTALRSPPDSRMTGALSPVMADSSTLAMPSITSPSPGIISPCSTSTTSPRRSSVAATVSYFLPFFRRLAMVSVLVLRSVSACALPRPSAMASAKLANSTVNHSQRVIWNVNPMLAPMARSLKISSVVMAAPTSTTNITGFFIISRGCSLTNESRMARFTMGGSSSGRARTAFLEISSGSVT